MLLIDLKAIWIKGTNTLGVLCYYRFATYKGFSYKATKRPQSLGRQGEGREILYSKNDATKTRMASLPHTHTHTKGMLRYKWFHKKIEVK